jgi:small subunit ribosomal protein S20
MANTSSAKKAARQNQNRRLKNISRKTGIKTAIRNVHDALGAEKFDAAQVQELLGNVAAKLARAKSKRVIHANTASRKLSRLAKKLHQRIQAAV